jgi:hypothetical protein
MPVVETSTVAVLPYGTVTAVALVVILVVAT